MSRCTHEGCSASAQFAPKLLVPAIGYPQEESKALSAVMGIELCFAHCVEFNIVEQLACTAPNAIRSIFSVLAQGKATPDFKRAWVKPIPLDSEEYLVLQRAKEKT